MFIRYNWLNFIMNEKSNRSFQFPFYLVAIFLTILVVTLIIFSSLTLNIDHTTIAQEQQQSPPFNEDLSFDIDNVTFSHHMASVNGIQLHYVTGGQGDPVVLLHGFPQSWYEWRHIMPALAKNYTVIAPDLRGFGDSSKPITGYDGKTTAEDIYQLIAQLGFNQPILLVAHDVGAQTAYSYTFAHPNNVSKLVIMDFPYPGFLPPEFGENGPWWFAFHQTPNLPEFLVEGKEREYISWFFKELAYNPSAITEGDIDIFGNHFSAPGTARSAFEYFRAFPIDAEQNIESAKTPITIPVLALGGDIYPGLGGDIPGNFAASSLQSLATNVTGVTVPLSGHWIPEEQPDFVIDQLSKFFD
jgi:pimeloyl-ACP methyl ester carboxylesterase